MEKISDAHCGPHHDLFEFFPEKGGKVAHFLAKVTDGAALLTSAGFLLFKGRPEKSPEPFERRPGIVGEVQPRPRLILFSVVVHQGQPQVFLAFEIKVKGPFGHAGRFEDFLEAGMEG
jgi:hypothetical protein